MVQDKQRKKQLDRQRTEWRKNHRTLNGRIILYPEKTPEHINARGSKIYNWFWKKILIPSESQHVPAIISTLRNSMKQEIDASKIRIYRTMIGMAEDAYQLKQLEDILEYDTELLIGKKPQYNTENGIIYLKGNSFTTDFNEQETGIILRDLEGIIVDVLSSEDITAAKENNKRNDVYKNWDYTKEASLIDK